MHPQATPAAAIYARVSTEDQAERQTVTPIGYEVDADGRLVLRHTRNGGWPRRFVRAYAPRRPLEIGVAEH